MANTFNIVPVARFDTLDANLVIIDTIVDAIRAVDFPVTDALIAAVGIVADANAVILTDIHDTDLPAVASLGYYEISDDILFRNDDIKEHAIGAYTKEKEIAGCIADTLRITFDMKSKVGATVYGKIYKDGVAHGTARSTALTTYQTYSEDLAFIVGDLIQLYAYSSNPSQEVYLRNLRILGWGHPNFYNNLV